MESVESFHKQLVGIKYLGDGAYCGVSQFAELVLWTENGVHVTNTVVIENISELEKYIKEVKVKWNLL